MTRFAPLGRMLDKTAVVDASILPKEHG